LQTAKEKMLSDHIDVTSYVAQVLEGESK